MPFLCTERGTKYPESRNNIHIKKVLQKTWIQNQRKDRQIPLEERERPSIHL